MILQWTWGGDTLLQDPVFISFRYITRSEIAGSYSSSIFSFLRNLHNISHNGRTDIHSLQQGTGFCFFFFFSTSMSILLIICLLDYSHSNTCEVISHCGFDLHLMISDIKYFFIYLLTICVSSFEKRLQNICKYFLRFQGLCLPFVDFFLCCAEVFRLKQSQLSIFAFTAYAFGLIAKKIHCSDQCQEAFPLCFHLGVLQFLVLHLSF